MVGVSITRKPTWLTGQKAKGGFLPVSLFGETMRQLFLSLMIAGVCLSLFGIVFSPTERLLWNRTASAPMGLYWLNDKPFTLGRWVVVSAKSPEAIWANQRGFVGKDWPLLKRIAGMPGDEICRVDGRIQINQIPHGTVKQTDSFGQELPSWDGCIHLDESQVFLMNRHPDSLDGRYFGPTNLSDIQSTAQLILEWR